MALSTTTAPELTQEQVANILVKPLADQSVFLSAGPRIFDTHGALRIPKLGAATNPSWHGENEQITEVDTDFDEVLLLPDTMKSVKTLTRFSNELARQSVIALDAALKDRLVTDVANTIDHQLLSAEGDGITKPKGLFAYTGVQTMAVDGPLALDDLHDAVGLAMGANVNTTAAKWIMRSSDFVAVRKLKDGDGRYMVQPDPTQAGAYSLLGIPVILSNRIPEGKAALVDFSQIAVARDLAPTVKVLDQTFGDYDQMALRVVTRYDAAPLNPEAVIHLTGVGTTEA